jgi:hypothetical protein
LIAGFIDPDAGLIRVGGRTISTPGRSLPPPAGIRASCPAVSSSASLWRARSWSSRRHCCSTNRSPTSTPICARISGRARKFVARFLGGTNIFRSRKIGRDLVDCGGLVLRCGQGE